MQRHNQKKEKQQPESLVDILSQRSKEHPDRLAYIFLTDGEKKEIRITYGALERWVKTIAGQLQNRHQKGQRVLLLFPPGLEFIASFFGCQYAGMVAVPAYPPDPKRLDRTLPRLLAIIADAGPALVLTNAVLLSAARALFKLTPALKQIPWLPIKPLSSPQAQAWNPLAPDPGTLAFLQYTSGSTGKPKGVMLTHGNILHNQTLIQGAMEHNDQTVFVGWLPLYHDMGLIGNVLQPLYLGIPCYLMSPIHFLQKPLCWLEAISRFGGTTSGAPNFAYDLCVRKITETERQTLDLRSWRVAFNGAEPIRAETLVRFVAAFSSCGLRANALFPCYGLAEGTLIVAGGPSDQEPVTAYFDGDQMAEGRVHPTNSGEPNARRLVSSGRPLEGQTLCLVNPETHEPEKKGCVGEIWVSGRSIAKGYWNRPNLSKTTFQAQTPQWSEKTFLRTGDLGFVHHGQLFVTGRIKDLIIIRGQNHYPQDIELSMEKAHPAVRAGCCAAFSIETDDGEKLVVVGEVHNKIKADPGAIMAAIRQQIFKDHDIQTHGLTLIHAKTIFKTSSGKIQRRACKKAYLTGRLSTIEVDTLKIEKGTPSAESSTHRDDLLEMTPDEQIHHLQKEMLNLVEKGLGIAPYNLNPSSPLAEQGLDSMSALDIQHQIEDRYGLVIDPTHLLDGSSLENLVQRILPALQKPLKKDSVPEEPLPSRRFYPLSDGQGALWFLHEFAPGNRAYHLAGAFQVHGELNQKKLKEALHRVCQRHDILRTTFENRDGDPIQVVHPVLEPEFSVIELAGNQASALKTEIRKKALEPFDLGHGPLIRATLFHGPATGEIFLLVIHHLIVDFWSIALLFKELAQDYGESDANSSQQITKAPLQYSDYCQYQRDQQLHSEGTKLKAFWREYLKGDLPEPGLPLDRARPKIQTFEGRNQAFGLSEELGGEIAPPKPGTGCYFVHGGSCYF